MRKIQPHVFYLFQQVLHLPLPALSCRHHLQFFLLGELSERRLLVCFILLSQLLSQQTHLFPTERQAEFGKNAILLPLCRFVLLQTLYASINWIVIVFISYSPSLISMRAAATLVMQITSVSVKQRGQEMTEMNEKTERAKQEKVKLTG